MMVVSCRVIVRFAAIDRLTQFLRKRRGPLAPREVARVMQPNRQCEGLRLPRFSEDRALDVLGQARKVRKSVEVRSAPTSCQAGSR